MQTNFLFMTTAFQTPQRRSRSKLQDASLVNGPMLLLRSIRGFSSNRSMLWLATVPLALFGLGIFNLSAHAADLPELNAACLLYTSPSPRDLSTSRMPSSA